MFNKMFFVMLALFTVIGQFSFGLEVAPLSTLPPLQPASTPIPFQTLPPEGTPMYYYTPSPTQTPEPLDISIINVVRESVSSGTSSYYRYYIWVGRTGGDMSAMHVAVEIYTGFSYRHHPGVIHTAYDYAYLPEGATVCFVTKLINITPRSGDEYPSGYVIAFHADPDDLIAESDEDNNSWICDSVIDECACCIGWDECQP
jgi:hypothetical protein